MTQDKRNDLNDPLPRWESEVNALLDGELDAASTEALKRTAAEDRELARIIIEAYELQRDMDHLGIEKAPLSLRRKLRQVPRQQQPFWRRQRWMMATAMAVVPLLAISVAVMQARQPSAAEVEQARQDLAVAFTYLDKVGSRTGGYLQTILGGELQNGVTENISKHFPYTENSQEEETHET